MLSWTLNTQSLLKRAMLVSILGSVLYCLASVAVVDVDRHPELIEQLLLFGRDLQSLYSRLTREKPNRALQVLLQDSFSLLAYTDPHSSPVRYLLQPSQREPVCAALNSAILREHISPLFSLSIISHTRC